MSMPKTPAQTVTSTVRKWLELPDDLLPVIPLVTVIANELNGPPVWLAVVAPSSSGKTDMLLGVATLSGVEKRSKVTPQTFASGMRPPSDTDQDPSYLMRLQQRGVFLLVLKDFGTILNMPPLQRNPIFAQLREIFDGAYDTAYGTGVEVDWSGKLGLLVGATTHIDAQHKLNAELGERFVYFRPAIPDSADVAMQVLKRNDDDPARKTAIAKAYQSGYRRANVILRRLRKEGKDCLAPEAYPLIAALGPFVAEARRAVKRDRNYYDSSYEVLPAEGPARVTETLKQIHIAATICYGDVEAANGLVRRIAIDSMPGKRRQLLCHIARSRKGVTASMVALELECHENTARRELEDLVAINFVRKLRRAKTDIYLPSKKLLAYAKNIFPNESSSGVALQKLFDLPNNLISEGEEEREEG